MFMVSPTAFDTQTFQDFLGSLHDAVYISNASSNAFQQKVSKSKQFFFESFPGKMIFLHQDEILGNLSVEDAILKLVGWKQVSDRAAHLAIEPSVVNNLKSIGIGNCYVVDHATELTRLEPVETGFRHECSFIGHIIPGGYSVAAGDEPWYPIVEGALNERKKNLNSNIGPIFQKIAHEKLAPICGDTDHPILELAHAKWLKYQATKESVPFRGWVLENSGLQNVQIYGGDPAYMHNVSRNLNFPLSIATTHPSVFEEEKIREIYGQSKVSINITSLQFDFAVINRFHDAFMSGGLCVTDSREGLAELETNLSEIAYEAPGEMAEKVRFFSHEKNVGYRTKLIQKVQAVIEKKCTYQRLVNNIDVALHKM